MPCLILQCLLVTLTSDQVEVLQKEGMHSGRSLVLTRSVHRSNLKLIVMRYKRSKMHNFEDEIVCASDDDDAKSITVTKSLWKSTLDNIKPTIKDHSVTML